MEVIITLFIALAFFLLGPFNPEPVPIDMMGQFFVNVPLNLLAFSLFLVGATYMAFWNFLTRFKASSEIRTLNRHVADLERQIAATPAVQPVVAVSTTPKTKAEEPEEVAGETVAEEVAPEAEVKKDAEPEEPPPPEESQEPDSAPEKSPNEISASEKFVLAAKEKARALLENENTDDAYVKAHGGENPDDDCFWTGVNKATQPQKWLSAAKKKSS